MSKPKRQTEYSRRQLREAAKLLNRIIKSQRLFVDIVCDVQRDADGDPTTITSLFLRGTEVHVGCDEHGETWLHVDVDRNADEVVRALKT